MTNAKVQKTLCVFLDPLTEYHVVWLHSGHLKIDRWYQEQVNR